jgi:Tfp pilus assembly PilM family ATPase
MARSFPPDVLVLDTESLVHARLGRGKNVLRVTQARRLAIAPGVFATSVVTPELVNEAAFGETVRRLRTDTGRWEKASLLLPDSWFRINLLDLPGFNDKQGDALEVLRWSLKRTLPIDPAELRVAYEVLSRTTTAARVIAVSAVDKTLASIEAVFAAAGVEIVMIEPIGLNLWNAIAVREAATAGDRLLVYIRDHEFTTAVFRAGQPLFIRSRNLTGERTVQQEVRLSASYLRESLRVDGFQNCYLAGSVDEALQSTLAAEFNVPVRTIALRDFAEEPPIEVPGLDAELTACTGVFTA